MAPCQDDELVTDTGELFADIASQVAVTSNYYTHRADRGLNVAPVQEKRPWLPQRDGPRRASVSAFGISGTNAHAIIEEAPRQNIGGSKSSTVPAPLPPTILLPLSGHSDAALGQQAQKLRLDLGS
ncbi:hypothetical protein McanCB56680_006454 [Microsporum canis]